MPDTVLRDGAPRDTDRVVAVWRTAVEATHHFLTPTDIDDYERRLASHFLPAVHVVVAQHDGDIVGFSGTSGHRLEMLFVDPRVHAQGVGSALLNHLANEVGAVDVDVNEQNPGAVAFYRRRGFDPVGRSPLDSDGRPFPILHLRRTARPRPPRH
ncbi:GNAT family N-acetyltransferase [Williamsia soli]|uniref:GNAT family N-acetyltransferase n=1 Tax=Williamsia soli TaxID=364929 RepID=UPI001A9F42BF|nr:GNAT family N-acetyltransferase [Williamsia soli]